MRERLSDVADQLAKEENFATKEGRSTDRLEMGYALKNVGRVIEALKKEHALLTLPAQKAIRRQEDFTPAELTAYMDNDPVAGTELRELMTLFEDLRDFATTVREGGAWKWEAVHIMLARGQSLYDKTAGFQRPIRTRP